MSGSGRRRRLAAGAFLAAIVAGLAVGTVTAASAQDTAQETTGRAAPEYSARVLGSDEQTSVASLKGDVVLLNTWATWCEPCKEEMPEFQEVHETFRDDGLRVVGVSIDEGRADGKVSRYVEGMGVTFPIWRDAANRFAKTFRVLGVPETLLIDRDGRIAYHWRGQLDPQEPDNAFRIRSALGLESETAGAAESAVASAGLLIAFGAGLISVLSPCVLPLIPSYASVIAGVSVKQVERQSPAIEPTLVGAPDGGGGRYQPLAPAPVPPAARRTALWASASFVAGFSAVFMALGVLVNRAGAALSDNRVWLSRVGGVVLLVLGLHLIGIFKLRAADREKRLFTFSGKASYAGVFLVGVAFAAGWSPCIGPVLAGILTMVASGGSALQAAGLLAAYCAGLAIPFLVAALALERFLRWSARMRRSWLPVAERVSGVVVLAVGVLLVTGVFSRMASWLAP